MFYYAFYGSENPGPNRQLVGMPGGGVVYIRIEEATPISLEAALRLDRPADDEVFIGIRALNRSHR